MLLIPGNAKFSSQGIFYAVLIGILINVAFVSYISAIKGGSVSISTVIRNLSVAITFVLAVVFLAEKVSFLKVIGAGLGIIAVILLSV